MVTNTGKVLDPTATQQHYGVLLEVMPDTGDVSSHFNTIGKAHTCDLTKGRVWLLRSNGHDPGANTTFLGTTGKSRRLSLVGYGLPSLSDQLINSRHLIDTLLIFF
jgi:hypothetical protein